MTAAGSCDDAAARRTAFVNVSKPTMLAHFAVLKEADLVHAEKAGKSVIYHLKLSVIEKALLGFVDSFERGAEAPRPGQGAAR